MAEDTPPSKVGPLLSAHMRREIQMSLEQEMQRSLRQNYVDPRRPPDLAPGLRNTPYRGVDLQLAVRDMRNGDVVAWHSNGYVYAAVKANDQWYTTATEGNPHVDQVLDNLAFANILAAADGVGYADHWRELP